MIRMGCALCSEIFLFPPEYPQSSPPRGLHVHGVGVARPALQPVVGGGGQVAEVILEGRVMPETETTREQEAEDEVGEEKEAVGDQEHVEEILLDPDHGDGWGLCVMMSVWRLRSLSTDWARVLCVQNQGHSGPGSDMSQAHEPRGGHVHTLNTHSDPPII